MPAPAAFCDGMWKMPRVAGTVVPRGRGQYNADAEMPREELPVEVIQKGYGEVKLAGGGESLLGEITLHAEGWVAVAPVPPSPDAEVRWFPTCQVAEVIWRKSVALQRPKAEPAE